MSRHRLAHQRLVRIIDKSPSPCWLSAATLLKAESNIGEENVSLRLILPL